MATLHRLTRQEEDVRRGTLLAVSGLSVLLFVVPRLPVVDHVVTLATPHSGADLASAATMLGATGSGAPPQIMTWAPSLDRNVAEIPGLKT